MGGEHSFWLKRFQSFILVFPLGFLLIRHLQLASTGIMTADRHPMSLGEFFWFGFVAVAILFYIVRFSFTLTTSSFNVFTYGGYRNWMYVLQRLTFLLMVPFLGYHAWMWGRTPPVGLLYSLGFVATVFHIVHGIAGMFTTWGVTISPQSQRAVSFVAWVSFFILSGWGLQVVFSW